MGLPEWIAIGSVIVAMVSLAVEQRLTRRQSKDESRDRHYDRTQTLLLEALRDSDLLQAIGGNSDENQKHRRYRQLWFNHIEMFFRNRHLFDSAHWKGTLSDIRSFMNMPAMREHWNIHGHYYSDDYRRFMEREIMGLEAEAPETGAPPFEDQASIT